VSRATWLGDYAAYAQFQGAFEEFARGRERSDLDADELAWGLDLALRAAVDAPIASVGEAVITASCVTGGAFRYQPYMGFEGSGRLYTDDFPEGALGEARDGHLNYSVLVPEQIGVGAIGMYFLEGRLGLLFHPQGEREPIRYPAMPCGEFVRKVREQWGIGLFGPGDGDEG
jgi:hypothetical protein